MDEPRPILNLTRGNVLCERVLIADTPLPRMRGLLGRSSLHAGEGILLQGVPSIHTAFMRFDFDALFLDARLRVIRVVPRLKPWRAVTVKRAASVLELAAGEAARRGVEVGDQIVLTDSDLAVGSREGPPALEVVEGGGAASADAGRRILLVGADRRFRSVASALLERRGYTVLVSDQVTGLAEVVARERVSVVVLDAGAVPALASFEAVRLEALHPGVGVVLVADDVEQTLPAPPVIAKWGAFDGLYEAIEEVRTTHAAGGGRSGVAKAS